MDIDTIEEEQRDEIIKSLETLNTQVSRQNSLGRRFVIGIVYGVGFIVGSAIVATILLGILAPWFAQIEWVRNAFEAGAGLLGR